MPDGKAPKVDDILSMTYVWMFQLVAFARKEEHWELEKKEAEKLGKISVSCINTIPVAAKAKVEAKFNKYLPWAALVGFGLVIAGPRVAISMENNKRKGRFQRPIPFPTNQEKGSENQVRENEPVGAAPVPANPAGNGTDFKSSFPPGPNPNFPPLDFQIS